MNCLCGMRRSMEAAEEQERRARTSRLDLEERLSRAEENLKNVEAERDKSIRIIQCAKNQARTYKEEKENEIHELKSQIEALRNEKESIIKRAKAQARVYREQKEKDIDELTNQIRCRKNTIELRNEIGGCEMANEAKIDEMRAKIEELNAMIDGYKNKNEKLNADNKWLLWIKEGSDERVRRQRRELDDSEANVLGARKALNKKSNETNKLYDWWVTSQRHCGRLNERNEKLSAEIERLKEHNDWLTGKTTKALEQRPEDHDGFPNQNVWATGRRLGQE